MRPYRGKRVDNGKWVYGYYVKITAKSYITDGKDYGIECCGGENLPEYIEVDPVTVEFKAGEFWFAVGLFEKMIIQSEEYQEKLFDK